MPPWLKILSTGAEVAGGQKSTQRLELLIAENGLDNGRVAFGDDDADFILILSLFTPEVDKLIVLVTAESRKVDLDKKLKY